MKATVVVKYKYIYTVYSIHSKSKYVSYIKERSVKEYINQRPSLFFRNESCSKNFIN